MRASHLLLIACMLGGNEVSSAQLEIIGSWSPVIGAADLWGVPGSDFRSPIESDSAQSTLAVVGTEGRAWVLKVRRSDSNMPEGVRFALRRTTTGSGPGAIDGGADYVFPETADVIFLTGFGDRMGINLQLKLEGVSLHQSPGFYGANLVYGLEQSP